MRRVILLLTVMAATLVLASGVALAVTKIGTNGPDTLRGTNGADNLLGNGANDVLYALGGNNDNLLGAEGKDWVLGGDEHRAFGGDKNLAGGPGNDGLYGGLGSDNVVGGSGNDFLGGDSGSDTVMGQEGRDFVDSGLRGCADRSRSAGRSAFPSVVHPAFSNQPPHDDHHLRERHPEIDHPPYPLRTPQQFLVRVMPRVRPLRHPTLPGP